MVCPPGQTGEYISAKNEENETMYKTAILVSGKYRYRFSLSETGHTLECEQWDDGTGIVDGTKRTKQWVKVWSRVV
jgi:hypothetical protein